MSRSNSFLTGAFILTLAGFLSRLIGFFYRAFLSQAFGAEGMGIYQLLSPVMSLSFSLTAAGIQTAISKYSAPESTTHDYRASLRILYAGLLISMPLSAGFAWFIYHNSDFIAVSLLQESRSAPLLRVFALSIPFCSIHSLVNGYFYGIKRAGIPALTQILEQLARVGSVFLICGFLQSQGRQPEIVCAVLGLTIGECFSTLISLAAVYLRFFHLPLAPSSPVGTFHMAGKIFTLSAPLAASRIAVNILQGIEAVSIPGCLVLYGFSQAQALSVYGVLTGMALPLIMFPSALVGSACVLLLPVIAEADENGSHHTIRKVIRSSIVCCALFGFLCTAFFLLFGRLAGSLLFKSDLAGSFILTLSFICPLMYLSGALSSILHGLGKTGVTFIFNMISLTIRLLFVFLLIPAIGIQGYLYGLLFSQFLTATLNMLAVRYYVKNRP